MPLPALLAPGHAFAPEHDPYGSEAVLAVVVADMGTGLPVSSSRWRGGGGRAVLHAKAGSRHRVSVAAPEGIGGGFTLEWNRVGAPVRLRHAGRLVDGGADARGATGDCTWCRGSA